MNLGHLEDIIIDKSDLGVLNDDHTLGYHLHGSIVLGSNYESKGISNVMTYRRPFPDSDEGQKLKATKRDRLPIGQKESYRWLLGVRKSTEFITNPSRLNFIFDREGDIYEMLDEIDSQGSKFIVRSQHNRKVELANGDISRLRHNIELQPVQDSYNVQVSADGRGNKKRISKLELKFTEFKILAPTHSKYETNYRPYIKVSLVQAREILAPNEAKPDNYICWNIITNKEVTSVEQAKKVIEVYSKRWCIEDVFRTMKNKGLQLDSLTLENGKALRKIAIMAFEISTTALKLRQAREGKIHVPIEEVFDSAQVECMKQINKKYEGKTEKQKNPHSPNSLAWAAWVIARLGGWSGYASQRAPGIITMKRGLQTFSIMFLGYSINET